MTRRTRHEHRSPILEGGDGEWNPPRVLAYTWNVFSPGETESPYPESYLTFALEPRGNQVLLALTHVPILERFERQNAMGWHTFLDILEAAINGHSSVALFVTPSLAGSADRKIYFRSRT
jgi:hypothetical protein